MESARSADLELADPEQFERLARDVSSIHEQVQVWTIAVSEAEATLTMAQARMRLAKAQLARVKASYGQAVEALEKATPPPVSEYRRRLEEVRQHADMARTRILAGKPPESERLRPTVTVELDEPPEDDEDTPDADQPPGTEEPPEALRLSYSDRAIYSRYARTLHLARNAHELALAFGAITPHEHALGKRIYSLLVALAKARQVDLEAANGA